MHYQLDTTGTLDSRQFLIAVRALADHFSYGTDTSPYLGTGTDYAQSRLYQAGDPVRSIDWRITARTQKVHVKEYETPKRMDCFLIVDTSASMTASSVPHSKYGMAVMIAGGIALACLNRISPVAVVGAGERELSYSPSLSRDRILQWLHRLRTFRVDEHTRLGLRFRQIGPSLLNRSLLIVLSDLHQPDALGPMKRLAQQHDVVAIQLTDPAEMTLPGSGFVRGREAETGRTITTRGRKTAIDQETLRAELRRGRVDHLVLRTDQPYAWKLRHFFKSRGLLGRGAK
jgi:uncharacterized protein (DUF58 family)